MDPDRPRFALLSLCLAAACALAWLLMGGAEMLDTVAERRGAGSATVLAGAGFLAWSGVLYVATRAFHWAWSRVDGPGR